MLAFHEEQPELLLFADGSVRAALQVARGETEFSLYDGTGGQCVKVLVDYKGEPHIQRRTGTEVWTDVRAERRA